MTVDSNTKKVLHDSTEQSGPNLHDQIRQLQSQVLFLQKSVETLEMKLLDASNRYVATCSACRTRFDMLAHHYSIGLFDNLVYVKCPKCHKALPVKGGGKGEVRVIEE